MKPMIYGASALTLSVLIAQPAFAQSETGDQPGIGLEEIIVTAQRRDENLQKAAIAVSAVSSEVLNAQVTAAQDLSKLVPSVVIGAGGGGTNFATIRGVGALAANGLAEQTVAISLDGVYLARPAAANGLYYDLARVEVLKGPQGTLYGRNASAGAINVITNRPKFETGGYIDAKIGNYDLVEVQGAINLALSDTVAVRVAGQVARHDGYLSDGYNDQDQYSGRVSLRVQPNEALSLQITGDYVHFGGRGENNVISPFIDPSTPYLGSVNPITNGILAGVTLGGLLPNGLPQYRNDGFNDTDMYGISGNISLETGAGELTLIPAYRRSDIRYKHYSAGFPIDNEEMSNQTTIEMRFATPAANRLRAVLGGYYFNETGSFTLDAYLLGSPGAGFPGPLTTRIDEYRTRSYAAFGQASFDLTDTLRLVGGLRYTHEEKDLAGASINQFTFVPTPITGKVSFNQVNWRAGVETDVGSASLLYATVATGFKAGGFFSSPAPNTFRPEKLVAYTIGSKNRFLDNRLQLNLEAYYWKYRDRQVTHLLNNTLVTENAGRATLYGIELETTFKPGRDDILSANILFNQTEYNSFVFDLPRTSAWNCPRTPSDPINDLVDCSGNELQQSPHWSINLRYEHSFRLSNEARIVAAASGAYRSSYWLGDERLVGQKQNDSFVLDLSLAYHAPDSRWFIGAYAKNIGNVAVKSYSFVSSIINVPVVGLYPPRTFGVLAGFDF